MASVGIVAYGLYVPRSTVSAAAVARRFHLPVEVVRAKQGFDRKHVSAPSVMPSDMGLRAGRTALERARARGVDRTDVGLVIYCGSQWKDYHVWLMSTFLQDRLGIPECFAFDVSAMCAGVVFGLYAAKNFLLADPNLRAVLLVGASKESYMVSPVAPMSQWMDNFADAGVAVVVARDYARNTVLGSDFLSDGSLSLAPVEAGGGARHPVYPAYAREGQVFAETLLPEAMFRRRMDEVSLPNFVRVIKSSMARSGLSSADIRLFLLNHMKRSFHQAIVEKVGVPPERAFYLDQYGHSQSADQILALDLALASDRFTEGPVVMAAAGSGYVWGSTVVRWG
jgi:3-oxoacyl-[acyl-carrier-protein] synthase III